MRRFLPAVFAAALLFGAVGVVAAELDEEESRIVANVDSLRVAFRAQDALAAIEDALPGAREAGGPRFLLDLLSRKGELLASTGSSAASRPALTEALDLAESLNDSLLACEALRWLGVATDSMNESDEARRIYLRLADLAVAFRRPEYEGWAEVGMGWQDLRQGRTAEGARRYRRAVGHFEAMAHVNAQRSDWGLIWAWNGIGSASRSLGEYTAALEAFESTAAVARRSANGIGESMAVNNVGTLAFSLGDPGTALEHFSRARDLQMYFGNPRGAVMPALNIALCRTQLGRYEAAEADLDSLALACRRLDYVDYEAVVRNAQGDLAINRGRLHEAIAHYLGILDLPGVPMKNRIEARIGLARAYGALGRHEEAVDLLDLGRDEVVGRDLFDQELRMSADLAVHLQELGRHREALTRLLEVNDIAASRGLTGYRVRALARAAVSSRALGRPDSCLAFLQEAALAWETERSLPLDPEWRERRGLSGRLVYTDLAAALLELEAEAGEGRRRAFDELQVFKARTLLERIHGPGSAADSSLASLEPVTLAGLQEAGLDAGEVLLDLYLGPGFSFLFAVTRDECRAVTLPPETEIARRVQGYNEFISRPPHPDVGAGTEAIIGQSSTALRDLVLGEVEDLLVGSRHVFFAPDGVLNLLSPAALSPAGSAVVWSRIPSATVLAHLREKDVSKVVSGRTLVLVGGRDGQSAPLPGALHEAVMLAERFDGVETRYCLPDSNETAVPLTVDDLDGCDILHLATHAHVDDESPWQSSISLPGFGRDGRLTAAEIAASRLDARLAVLAACESGSGRVLSGEGVLGLAGAFLSSGVPAVVATLWSVDDATTTRVMSRFYDEVRAGSDAANALQAAREAVRADPATSHPFFWAGYILVGDGRIEAPLERRWPLSRVIPGAFGVLALGLLVYSFRRRG